MSANEGPPRSRLGAHLGRGPQPPIDAAPSALGAHLTSRRPNLTLVRAAPPCEVADDPAAIARAAECCSVDSRRLAGRIAFGAPLTDHELDAVAELGHQLLESERPLAELAGGALVRLARVEREARR